MIIGVDLGGTNIKFGLVDNGKIIRKIKMKTEADKGSSHVVKRIITGISLVKEGYKIEGIGIGSPGPLDYKQGIVINPPNLPFRNFNLKKVIQERFKMKVEVENDAKCAALAEKNYGKGKHLKNFIVLTIGTGVGSGAILDGKLYHGNMFATEIGHMIIRDYKDVEDLVSGTAIESRAKKVLGKRIEAKDLVISAKLGNKGAKKLVDEIAKDLAIAFTNITHIFDPELIIINGGVKEAGSYLFDKAKKEMNKMTMFEGKIALSDLENAGILGAASLIK